MIKLALVMTLAIILTGCTSFKADKSSVQSSTSSIDSYENVSSSEPSTDTSSQNTNSDISISFMADEDDRLGSYDFKSVYVMCVQAITEYQDARTNGKKMDFFKYVEDPKLISYLETKLDSFYDHTRKTEVTKTGLVEFEVQRMNGTGFDADRIYLQIAWSNIKKGSGGFSTTTRFILKNSNGRLVIAEWFDDVKDSIDILCRGHLDIKEDDIYWNTADIALLDKKIAEHNEQYKRILEERG